MLSKSLSDIMKKEYKEYKEYKNEWILINKKKKVLFHSKEFVDVFRESKKYPLDKNTITKIRVPGTCCY